MKKVLLAACSLLLMIGFSWSYNVFAQVFEGEDIDVFMVAYPQKVVRGMESSIEWNSEGADYCIASGAWKGKKESSGKMQIKVKKKGTYSLQCFDEDGNTSKKISKTITTVTKLPSTKLGVPNIVFKVSSQTPDFGMSTMLSWESKNAVACFARVEGNLENKEDAWDGLKMPRGNEEVLPEDKTTYVIKCVNAQGVFSKERKVVVSPTSVISSEEEMKEEVKEEKKQDQKQEVKKEEKKDQVKQEKKEDAKKDEPKSSLANLVIALDPSLIITGQNVTRGDIGVELARFMLTASDKDVKIGSIHYATSSQLLNIKTYNGTIQIGNTLVLRSSSKVLELNPPLVIPVGNSISLRVVADVAYDAQGSVSVGITDLYPPVNTTNFSYTTGSLPLHGNAMTVKDTDTSLNVPQPVKIAVALDMATSLSRKIFQGDTNVNFGQFNIIAAEKDVSLKGVRIVSSPSGSALNTKVYSENTQMGTTLVSGEGYVEFASPFVVKAFTTRTLRLVADVSSSAKSSIRLGISDLVFSLEQKGVISGTLPVYGSDMTLGENWEESLKILFPSTSPHSLTFQRGSIDNKVLTLDFMAPSGMKKASITQVAYRCSQDCSQLITLAKLKDETNNAYIGNTVSVTKEGSTLLIFTLTNPYIINENTKGTLSLIVDFQKSTPDSLASNSLISFTIESISGVKENGSALSIAGQPLIGVMHTLKN